MWRRCRGISRRLHHVFLWYFEGRLWRFLADVRTSLRWAQALQTLSPERSKSSRVGSRVLAGSAAVSETGAKRAAERRTDDAPTRAVYQRSRRLPRRAVNLASSPSYARDLASSLDMASTSPRPMRRLRPSRRPQMGVSRRRLGRGRQLLW